MRVPIRLPGKQSKYRAQRTNGYASKREAKRAAELEILQREGYICALETQVRIELIPPIGKERACHWVADFVYTENSKRGVNEGVEIWEDCKGFRTPLYKLKRKLILYRYGKVVRET